MCQHQIGFLEALYISPACGLCFSQVVDPARRRYSDGELQFDQEAQAARKVALKATAKSAAAAEKLKLKQEKAALRKHYDKILARQRKLYPRENFAKA